MSSIELAGKHGRDWLKISLIIIFCLSVLAIMASIFSLVLAYKLYLGPRHNNFVVDSPPINGISYNYQHNSRQSVPIVRSNLIFFSVSINNLSDSMNRLIEDENLNVPPARFYDSSLSYRNSTGWAVITGDATVFFIYNDVSDKLTLEEVRAVSLHELGHIVLRHSHVNRNYNVRDIETEKAADKLALVWGADPEYLISAIAKLSMDKAELEYRKSVIG